MTLAPRYFATWIPALPRPPDAPITSTQSPDFIPAMSRSMLKATGAWRATTVATVKSTPSGIGCVHATGTFTYCAYPPQTCRPRITGNEFAAGGRTNCSVTTRSPLLRAVTPGPTAATTPDGSTPSTCGSFTGTAYAPARTTRSSVRFTDTARTSMSTSSASGTGVGTSSRRITSGGPNSRMTIAFIARSFPLLYLRRAGAAGRGFEPARLNSAANALHDTSTRPATLRSTLEPRGVYPGGL